MEHLCINLTWAFIHRQRDQENDRKRERDREREKLIGSSNCDDPRWSSRCNTVGNVARFEDCALKTGLHLKCKWSIHEKCIHAFAYGACGAARLDALMWDCRRAVALRSEPTHRLGRSYPPLSLFSLTSSSHNHLLNKYQHSDSIAHNLENARWRRQETLHLVKVQKNNWRDLECLGHLGNRWHRCVKS